MRKKSLRIFVVVNLGSLPLKSSWEFLPRITLIFTNRKRKKFASIREIRGWFCNCSQRGDHLNLEVIAILESSTELFLTRTLAPHSHSASLRGLRVFPGTARHIVPMSFGRAGVAQRRCDANWANGFLKIRDIHPYIRISPNPN